MVLLLAALLLTSSRLQPPSAADPLDHIHPGGERLTFTADRYDERLVDAQGPAVARGRALFFREWPDGTAAGRDFDARSCAECHVETVALRTGRAPRIARPVSAADMARYGPQLTTRHDGGRGPEAVTRVRWEYLDFTYADGDTRQLRRPLTTAVTREGETVSATLRSAPLLFGWGLMAQIPSRTLAFFDDPFDVDGDGISGRMAMTDDATGFLGWKNSEESLRDQIAAALRNDMGIHPGAAPGRISARELDALVAYVAKLGAPAQRPAGNRQHGELLFGRVGCAACHVPALMTGKTADPAFSEQLIWPYTDLMLHDMGAGLADPGDASDAAEWRTAPLWGAGLAERRLPERGFLHDGRARNLEEAVLWHGGEARRARDRFAALPAVERGFLLEFLRSL